MTLAVLLTVAAVVISAANFVVLLLSFRRAGQWKDSEDARRLIERVSACESSVTVAMKAGEALLAVTGRLQAVEGDVTGLKVRMENVATKADIARLASEVQAVENHAGRIEAGVERIEGYLMNRQTQ